MQPLKIHDYRLTFSISKMHFTHFSLYPLYLSNQPELTIMLSHMVQVDFKTVNFLNLIQRSSILLQDPSFLSTTARLSTSTRII